MGIDSTPKNGIHEVIGKSSFLLTKHSVKDLNNNHIVNMHMQIGYFHGFGSKFDPNNSKVKLLSQLDRCHKVLGVDLDYTLGAEYVTEKAFQFIDENRIDLLVGTSMGGWLAAKVGHELGIPWVACNPSINPSETLVRYIGHNVDFTGKGYTLERSVIRSYDDMVFDGCGLILLDMGDELLDATKTALDGDGRVEVVMFNGGSHRFEHMAESLCAIDFHYDKCIMNYDIT